MLARDLLKDTGIIIVAIGDDEHHRLRMLLDQVFDETNFLAGLTWQGRVKNDRRFTGGGVDYMLCYGKSQAALIEADIRWKEPTPGATNLLEVARTEFHAAAQAGSTPDEAAASATQSLRRWVRENRTSYAGGLIAYQSVDNEGRVYRSGPLDSPNMRPNLIYEVLHPETGLPILAPAKGWRVSQSVMQQMRESGQIVWGRDHTTGIGRKLILNADATIVPAATFTADRDTATKHLRSLLGEVRFPNPKAHEVLMRWLGIIGGTDSIFVDFFGGSGSALEAVMRLNLQDGRERQCVLVTNNELEAKEANP